MWLNLGSKISTSIRNHLVMLRASFTAIFITAVAQKYLLESSIYKYKYENKKLITKCLVCFKQSYFH